MSSGEKKKKAKWTDIQVLAYPSRWTVEVGDGIDKFIEIMKRRKERGTKGAAKLTCIQMANEALDWVAEQLNREGFPVERYNIRVLCPSLDACKIMRRQTTEFLAAKAMKTFNRLSGEFEYVSVQAINPDMK